MKVLAQTRSHASRAFMPTRYRIFIHGARVSRRTPDFVPNTLTSIITVHALFRGRRLCDGQRGNWPRWTAARDTDILNPGSSVEVVRLRNGLWMEVETPGQYQYPSVMQSRDDAIHVTYSNFTAAGKSIKHARFNEEWIRIKPE